ncbi:hypothetical protein K7432_002216 [Basidiobolus ranarum]|uniref:Uncharacterized protein n=1 Tax=Basidiobolus ranarum TaxID=34480 RepID=A0ABR2X252_9FUNG
MSAEFPWSNWENQAYSTGLSLDQVNSVKETNYPYLPTISGTNLKRTQFSDDESELSLDLEEDTLEAPSNFKKPRHRYWSESSSSSHQVENNSHFEESTIVLPRQLKPIHISTRTSNEPEVTEYDNINQLLNAVHQTRRQTHSSDNPHELHHFSTPVYENYQNINEVLRDLHLRRRNP